MKTIFPQDDKRFNKLFIFISIGLLLLSFTQQAYCVDGDCGDYGDGLGCFLLGGLVILYEPYGISWLLNPALLISYFPSMKYLNIRFYLAIASVLFGLSFLCFSEVIKNEAGHYGVITGYALGYWLWISSAVVNLIGIGILKYRKATTAIPISKADEK
ncbi:hypothetical protein [Elizabethkingia sp. JS20170427COW]|uniref:hypothetical protein n=1 Tax=Elizabethkingia sp. JS20170427COW TaxID=2583851 RepID=UPI00111073E6|nr:hypothetical protein [Elizabethkingia sp. JS20170427COW]QCX52347.1 hypothetical protein FGE20_00565 [Elizabethkingia sp. JS20170427COW]